MPEQHPLTGRLFERRLSVLLSPYARPMQPTFQSQPHRRDTGRQPSMALAAMLRGGPAFLPNPMDVQRRTLAAAPTLADLLASAGRSTLRR